MPERRKSHGPSLRRSRDGREGRNCHALGRDLLACSRRPLEGQLNEHGTLAARALIARRRYCRADLHCLKTVDYPAATMTYAVSRLQTSVE